MPLFGELFVSEILGEPVLDPRGEELGRLKDLIIVKADPLPKVSAIILERKKRPYMIEWASLELFNKRIITARILSSELRPYDMTSPDLLAVRDLLDKQIVDVNGVKVVRVKDAEDIQELLGHDEDTAGGLMTNEFIVYPSDMTVQEVLNRFKEDASEIETVYYIYVTDSSERLLGVLSLRELLIASPEARLSEIMVTKLKTVTPDVDEKVVAEVFTKYNLVSLPVVDTEGALLGIVTVDDVMERIFPVPAKRK